MNTMSAIMNVIVLLAVFGVVVRAQPMFAGKEYAAGVKQLISDKAEVTLPIRHFTNNNENPFKTAIFRVKRQDGAEGADATTESTGGTPEVQSTQATTELATPATTESSGTKTTISKAAILVFSLLILVKGNFVNC